MALCYTLNSILAYFYIDLCWTGYLVHLSLLPALTILSQSFVLKFCVYHRIPIYYILLNDVLTSYDYYVGIPLSDKNLLMFNMVLCWIAIFAITYFYVKNHKNVAKKVT